MANEKTTLEAAIKAAMSGEEPTGKLDTQVAVLYNEVKHITSIAEELLRVVKGDNGAGLVTKVAILEKHPENCQVKTSVKWLTWGVRGIYTLIILGIAAAWITQSIGGAR